MKENIRLFDIVVVVLALGLTGFSFFSIYIQPRGTTQVVIESRGRRWIYPLTAEETIPITGILGDTIVRISENEAWVESSHCDNQVCVAAGRLTRSAHFAACLPNNVMVILEGFDEFGHTDSTSW